ncbi:hypothetical protein [Shewanella sp. YIC-542]|uniref:hypothetical protein n=1 Tax=Shewanella mytili TaxID=3377111 RepID=UPI00398ED0C9
MKLSMPVIFTLCLFGAALVAVLWINDSSPKNVTSNWTAFIYHHGFGSANYLKQEDFSDYASCRQYAMAQSQQYDNAPWECGKGCRFDSRRQGYMCDEMRNH